MPCVPLLRPQKVRLKNQEMKVLMDQMRNLLWDVNAMLTLRKC
ncbi:Mediator of RNA polymerase II transcription subunit 30 [Liparis tanakae]|uniref:Mediator of RNA polymerase II transcription subunit 30 n=1 Tax=Liparis tanakae TaxID=230148 RepID=A0A4Z2E9Y2_9TELE|nr:Mediator of RNA polymerase II transcription subunit 30 [Liparis tanakae]